MDNMSELFDPILIRHGICYSLSKDINVEKSGLGSGLLLILDINADEFSFGSVGTNLSPGASVCVPVFRQAKSEQALYLQLGGKEC